MPFPLTHKNILLLLAAASALALFLAYLAQYAYGLAPCELCLYQRVPFYAVIALALAAHATARRKPGAAPYFLGLSAIVLLVNAGIAFYHSGVERKWWASFVEGCTIPEIKGNITDVLARIAATPAARCDEIPWTDPLIGLSMANYNVIFCAALALATLYGLSRRASWQNPARP